LNSRLLADLTQGEENQADSGLGLKNTRKRLYHLYGDLGCLEFSRAELGGLCVSLRLPFVAMKSAI